MARRKGPAPPPFAPTFGLAAGSSVVFWLAFPNASIWPLGWVALAPLFVAMVRTTPARAALASASAGLILPLLSLWGFHHLTFGAYFSPAVIGAFYYAGVGALVSWACGRRGLPLLLVVPPVWTAYEYLRAVVPVIKFPWLLAGQTQVRWTTLIQICDLGGVYLLSIVVVIANVAVAQAWLDRARPHRRRRHLRLAALPVALVIASLLYGAVRLRMIEEAEGPRIALVQGNVPQEIKMEEGTGGRMMNEYLELSREALEEDPALVAWPETMYPWLLDPEDLEAEEDPEYKAAYLRSRDDLFRIGRDGPARLLVGALRRVAGDERNSAYYISETGEVLGRYDKIDLVPLAEAIPFEESLPGFTGWVRRNFLPPGFGQLQRGEEIPLFDLEGRRFAVSICYEISFSYLAREAKAKGADFLVTISNDAWFKKGGELDMAKDQAIFRAVESRIGIARAANTGISSFVSPTGEAEIIEQGGLRKQVEGVLVRPVAISPNGSLYVRIGDSFAMLMVLASMVIAGAALRRPPSGASPTERPAPASGAPSGSPPGKAS